MTKKEETKFGAHWVMGSDEVGTYLRAQGVTLRIGSQIDVLQTTAERALSWVNDYMVVELREHPKPRVKIALKNTYPIELMPDQFLRLSNSKEPVVSMKTTQGPSVPFGQHGTIYRRANEALFQYKEETYAAGDFIDVMHHDGGDPVPVDGYKIIRIAMSPAPKVEIALLNLPMTELSPNDTVRRHIFRPGDEMRMPVAFNSSVDVVWDGAEFVLKTPDGIYKSKEWIELIPTKPDQRRDVNYRQPRQILEITPEPRVSLRADGSVTFMARDAQWKRSSAISPVTVTPIARDFKPVRFDDWTTIRLNDNATATVIHDNQEINVGDHIDIEFWPSQEQTHWKPKDAVHFTAWREGLEVVEVLYNPPTIAYIDSGVKTVLQPGINYRKHQEKITPPVLNDRIKSSEKEFNQSSVQDVSWNDEYQFSLIHDYGHPEKGEFWALVEIGDPKDPLAPRKTITVGDEVTYQFPKQQIGQTQVIEPWTGDVQIQSIDQAGGKKIVVVRDFFSPPNTTVLPVGTKLKKVSSPGMASRTPESTQATQDPRSLTELIQAAPNAMYWVMNAVKDDIRLSELRKAVAELATAAEKLAVGDKARGFKP